MEDSSSPSSLRVWPRSWRTVRNARCRRGRAHRICRTRQLHAARHSGRARPPGGIRGMARRSFRPRPVAGARSGCTGPLRGVRASTAGSSREPAFGVARGRVRHRACRPPCPSRSGRVRRHGDDRRKARTGWHRARAAASRTSGTGPGWYARRRAGGGVRGRRDVSSRRRARTGCARARAAASRISGTTPGRGARRCAGGSAPGRARA